MIYVVGSGPSGVAAAFALLRQGLEVTMLDGGVELEDERHAMVQQMDAAPKQQWKEASIQELKKNSKMGAGGIPLKLVYGSDFHYRYSSKYTPMEATGVQVLSSLARGGLSNVWGAAILPYTQREIQDWPVTEEELKPHYRAVTELIPVSAQQDNLSKLFPLYTDKLSPLEVSPQGKEFLKDIIAHEAELSTAGVTYGQARLAVNGNRCVKCGLCMYGCPHRLIYSTQQNFERLRQYPQFHYKPGYVVKSVGEEGGEVIVHAETLGDGGYVKFKAAKVFLGCGILSTTKVLLTSMKIFDKPIEMKTSQHFLIPMFRHRSVPNVKQQDVHTLAQLFLELDDRRVSPHLIHMQLYSYMDLFVDTMKTKLNFLYPFSKWALDSFFYGRFLLLQGYLHSDESCSIELQLSPGGVLRGQAKENSEGEKTLQRLVRKLNTLRGAFKTFPLGLGSELSPAGVGAHLGGTFPMKKQPQKMETDFLGRPTGFEHVHVIDPSTFPSIPATTITYTIMANAHRIAAVSTAGMAKTQ